MNDGIGSDYATVEKFIRDDPEAMTLWTEATRRNGGGDRQSGLGRKKSSVDNINGGLPKRPDGTSKEYVHRRLQRSVENGDQRAIGIQRQLHNREIIYEKYSFGSFLSIKPMRCWTRDENLYLNIGIFTHGCKCNYPKPALSAIENG